MVRNNLEMRHLFMGVGALIMIVGLILGIATETYLFPILIFLIGVVFLLIMGLRPMFTDEHTVFLIVAIIVSFPLVVMYHESVHFTVGSINWPGLMSLQVNFMSGVTTAAVTQEMVMETNEYMVWLFYASAPLVCVVTASLLIFIPLKKYKSINRLPNAFKYVLVFATIMLAFNLFALYPDGAADLGQANNILIANGANETLSTIMHFAIFFIAVVLLAVVGAKVLWKKTVI